MIDIDKKLKNAIKEIQENYTYSMGNYILHNWAVSINNERLPEARLYPKQSPGFSEYVGENLYTDPDKSLEAKHYEVDLAEFCNMWIMTCVTDLERTMLHLYYAEPETQNNMKATLQAFNKKGNVNWSEKVFRERLHQTAAMVGHVNKLREEKIIKFI